MKCLSLWQPWATLIAIGAKKYETRSWFTSYRGPLLIHAAKRHDEDSLALCIEEPFRTAILAGGINKIGDLPFGAIVGAVHLDNCLQSLGNLDPALLQDGTRNLDPALLQDGTRIHEPERSFGDYYPGRFAWRLTNPRRFSTPIPYRGLQQLFNVPDELVPDQLTKAVPT